MHSLTLSTMTFISTAEIWCERASIVRTPWIKNILVFKPRIPQCNFHSLLKWFQSFRSTCSVEFVTTHCWSMFLCRVSQRGPPLHQQQWCSCRSTGRGRVMWSTMDSSTATRQKHPTRYWRCVTSVKYLRWYMYFPSRYFSVDSLCVGGLTLQWTFFS